MNDLENDTHRHILEKLLIDFNIQKTDFAVRLGYTKKNYTNYLNKPMYTQKLIKKICTELNVPESVFDLRNGAPFQINQHNGMVSQNITGDLYERLLGEKQARIESLERQLIEAKDAAQELRKRLNYYENQK